VINDQPPNDGHKTEDDDGAIAQLPDVAWISARDGSRAPGDLEDQAARYHAARHELTINADFRAISDLIAHWRRRYPGVPGARLVIESQVCEWCEQILVEVVLRGQEQQLERWPARRAPLPYLILRRPASAPPAPLGPAKATRPETGHTPDPDRDHCGISVHPRTAQKRHRYRRARTAHALERATTGTAGAPLIETYWFSPDYGPPSAQRSGSR
jgi:hypothetical protein